MKPASVRPFPMSHVLSTYARFPVTLVRGEGTRVWDDAGKSYLDFCTGIAVCALGHCPPRLVNAIREQAGTLMHVSNLYGIPQQEELARVIVEDHVKLPGKVFFSNSGAEANDGLIKTARKFGHTRPQPDGSPRYEVLSFNKSFHGRTLGGINATGQDKVKEGFDPLLPGFRHLPFNDLAALEVGISPITAAILLEPVQGEGGVNVATPEFLRGVAALCKKHDLLLLLDEVQCGIGRTGRFFSYEYAGVTPDAIGMAKGLGGGFPIGAVWVRERNAELFHPGNHGTTFGGTPLACAAALAVLDVIERDGLLEQVRVNSAGWAAELRKLAVDFPAQVLGVRGQGFLVGVQLAGDPAPYLAALRERGLLAPSAGGNVVRLLPPLNVSTDELAQSVEIFRAVLAAKA